MAEDPVLSLIRHYTFHSAVHDVGIFHQVLWNTAHGTPFAAVWDARRGLAATAPVS